MSCACTAMRNSKDEPYHLGRPFLVYATFILSLAALFTDRTLADEQILLNAWINNQPVRLAFDTGSKSLVLWRSTAERLGVKITKVVNKEPLPAGRVPFDVAEDCYFDMGFGPQKAVLAVVDTPAWGLASVDGVIGWDCWTNGVVQINVGGKAFAFTADLPADLKGWAKWKLMPNSSLLVFECFDGKQATRIGIDSANPDGVLLNRQRWRQWRTNRAHQPRTIHTGYLLGGGEFVTEVLRAKKMIIGGLTLNDVLVSEASPWIENAFGNPDAIFGLFVFKQLAIIIDGSKGALYTRPIAPPVGQYDYNRLGAVFVPNDLKKDDDLVAHVVEGSLAFRAGIRNGDILVEIGAIDVTKWRTNPHILPLSRFWAQAAGTKLKLTLKRGDQQYETAVTLEELPAVE